MSESFNPIIRRPRNRGWGGAFQMWYEDEDGIWQSIERPADWATIPYFLGIDQATGLPTWLALPGAATEDIVRTGHIASTLQLFPPSLIRVVVLPFIGPTAVLYPPAMENVGVAFIPSGSQMFPPAIIIET